MISGSDWIGEGKIEAGASFLAGVRFAVRRDTLLGTPGADSSTWLNCLVVSAVGLRLSREAGE